MSATSTRVLGFVGTLINDRRRMDLDELRAFFNQLLKFLASFVLVDQAQGSDALRSDLVDSIPDTVDQGIFFHLVQASRDRLLVPIDLHGDVRSEVAAFLQLLENPPISRELEPHHTIGHVGAT